MAAPGTTSDSTRTQSEHDHHDSVLGTTWPPPHAGNAVLGPTAGVHSGSVAASRAGRGDKVGGERADRLGPARVEIALSVVGILVTLVAIVGVVLGAVRSADSGSSIVMSALFLLLVSGLLLGSLAYVVSRLGFNLRRNDVRETEPLAISAASGRDLLVLVPSYREEPSVVRQTLLSAALQTYPEKHVVLLIDDPPAPSDDENQLLLDAARRLPDEVDAWLDDARQRTRNAADRFSLVAQDTDLDRAAETARLADHVEWVVAWLDDAAAREPQRDHTDHLFVSRVLRAPAIELRLVADRLRSRRSRGENLSIDELFDHYRQLAHRFEASFSTFERKRYENLSREPNKAMNLNSFLALLGRRWREEARRDGLYLVEAGADDDTAWAVPCPEYVVTLDADSIIEPCYVATLVQVAERPEGADLAVVQTPYSAIPTSDTNSVERIAGATTDIQYAIHQGFTHFGAAFWVGANALIRTSALEHLRTTTIERGHRIERFVSDRTVIEDTESSLDLAAHGWRIHNHPERLSFSATPPDFGSLIIQRRRWANGGLILIPKLAAVWRHRPANLVGLFLRSHYLVSIAATNVALLVLLLSGFGAEYASWWLPVSALPYITLYARDLHQAGYRRRDVFSIYALNLLLVPANVAGVVKSVDQVVRRTKTSFARTPKVEGRTPAAPIYHIASVVLLLGIVIAIVRDLAGGQHAHAAFAGVNALLLVFAITAFVGWRALIEDVAAGLSARLMPPSETTER